MSDDDRNTVDLDALLAEAGLEEPEEIALRWKGQDWKIKRVNALDPRLLTKVSTVEEVVELLTGALGPEQFEDFPMPRTVPLPDGRTELGFFLDSWAEASGESASLGESEPSQS